MSFGIVGALEREVKLKKNGFFRFSRAKDAMKVV